MTIEDVYTTLVHHSMLSVREMSPPIPKPSPGQSIKFPKGRKNGGEEVVVVVEREGLGSICEGGRKGTMAMPCLCVAAIAIQFNYLFHSAYSSHRSQATAAMVLGLSCAGGCFQPAHNDVSVPVSPRCLDDGTGELMLLLSFLRQAFA
jgi:hypothetical protein